MIKSQVTTSKTRVRSRPSFPKGSHKKSPQSKPTSPIRPQDILAPSQDSSDQSEVKSRPISLKTIYCSSPESKPTSFTNQGPKIRPTNSRTSVWRPKTNRSLVKSHDETNKTNKTNKTKVKTRKTWVKSQVRLRSQKSQILIKHQNSRQTSSRTSPESNPKRSPKVSTQYQQVSSKEQQFLRQVLSHRLNGSGQDQQVQVYIEVKPNKSGVNAKFLKSSCQDKVNISILKSDSTVRNKLLVKYKKHFYSFSLCKRFSSAGNSSATAAVML